MKKYSIAKKLMGSAFELTIVHEDKEFANKCLDIGVSEIKRLEKKLTEFSDDSLTSLINRYAGIKPIEVDDETFKLIKRSLKLSELTQGAFDVTASSFKNYYEFKNKENLLPDKKSINTTLSKSGYKNIVIKEGNKVFLKYPGMKIGFGAIGKGFAADAVKNLWCELGVENGVINASGDLTVLGNNFNENWTVGIADPDNTENILFHIPLINSAVATSGDYEQYFTVNGKKFSHNVNPKSGIPLTDVKSTSVISPSAELSDALATAVSVLGAEVGIHLINQLPETHAIIINKKNEMFYSKSINLFHEEV
jgi:thiamine biosynthesis lipoprotein